MPELDERDNQVDRVMQQLLQTHLTDAELGMYHDDVLDEIERARAAAHIKRCTNCEERYQAMERILSSYQDVEVSTEAVEQLRTLAAKPRPLS